MSYLKAKMHQIRFRLGLQWEYPHGTFLVDVPRGRGDKMGTIFYNARHQKFVRAKNRLKFFAIFDRFRLWSRISPKSINISKIGKALDHLQPQPLPRWMEKVGVLWSTNEKVIGSNKFTPQWTFVGRLYFGPSYSSL